MPLPVSSPGWGVVKKRPQQRMAIPHCGRYQVSLAPAGLTPNIQVFCGQLPTQEPVAVSRTGPGTGRRRYLDLASGVPEGRGTVQPAQFSRSKVLRAEGGSGLEAPRGNSPRARVHVCTSVPQEVRHQLLAPQASVGVSGYPELGTLDGLAFPCHCPAGRGSSWSTGLSFAFSSLLGGSTSHSERPLLGPHVC